MSSSRQNEAALADWTEDDSEDFLDCAEYYVPDRRLQKETIVRVARLAAGQHPFVDLCCGDGTLAEGLLEANPQSHALLLDRSPAMLKKASERLQRFNGRFECRLFDLQEQGCAQSLPTLSGVVSSLAIHHLDGAAKRSLFDGLYQTIQSGGSLLIADIVEPVTPRGREYAAWCWDRAVDETARHLGKPQYLQSFRADDWNYFSLDPAASTVDQPSSLLDQVHWLREAGFRGVDVYWMKAGHAIFGGFVS